MIKIYGTILNKENTSITKKKDRKKISNDFIKEVFNRFYGLSETKLIYNYFNKPSLINGQFKFNISHSGQVLIMAVDIDYIGIDIEQVKSIDINPTFPSEREQKYLRNKDLFEFYKIWTVKESFSKNLGLGLSLDFKNFSVDLLKPYILFNSKKFHYSILTYENYIISICSENEMLPNEINWL